MVDNKPIKDYIKLLTYGNGFVPVTKEFIELENGDMFCSTQYDTLYGMKISRIFNEGRWYNCLDLECGELYYIPEHEKVCIYTQLCMKNHKY